MYLLYILFFIFNTEYNIFIIFYLIYNLIYIQYSILLYIFVTIKRTKFIKMIIFIIFTTKIILKNFVHLLGIGNKKYNIYILYSANGQSFKRSYKTRRNYLLKKKDTIGTSKLIAGTWIKNYKELCILLNQPVGTGNQKKRQLSEFERYFSYVKDGMKFFITEVYETPLPSNKIAHNAKYVKYIQNILLSYLSEQKEEQINIKKSQLYLLLGMINTKYYRYHNNRRLLEDLPELKASDIADFYQRCDNKLNKILKTSLDSLKRRYLLDYYETYIIGISIHLENNSEVVEYHEADDDERQLILHIQRDTLQELGMSVENEVFFKGKQSEYYNLFNERLAEYGWSMVFKTYHFIYNKDHILEARDEAIAKEASMKELNDLVVEALDSQAINRFEKEQELMNQLAIVPTIKLKYPESYVQAQKTLSSNLIKL